VINEMKIAKETRLGMPNPNSLPWRVGHSTNAAVGHLFQPDAHHLGEDVPLVR
jgi:hypothetical protein